MTGWVLYDDEQYKKNSWFAQRLVECLSKTAEVRLILTQSLQFGTRNGEAFFSIGKEQIKAPDFAVSRTIFPLLSSVLESAGTRVFNNFSVSKFCNDKRYTYSGLAGSNIPILDTWFFEKRFFSPESIEETDYPMVLKSAAGHGGSEVFLLKSKEELLNALNNLSDGRFLLQKVCPSVGKDVRVYLLGGKVLAAILRTSDNFKSNYSLGGKASLYELNSREKDLINKVLSMMPEIPDFVGMDFLIDGDKWYFNEIEDVVGTRMLYECLNMDAAEVYSEYITVQMSKENCVK